MDKLKKIFLTLIIVTLSTSCKTINKEKLTAKENINTIISEWHNNAKNANFNDFFNRISNDGYYLGTDQEEIWTKQEFKAFSKPYFDKKETWNFKAIKRNIFYSKDKKVVWFNELLDTWMGICRGSGILELENNEWKIKQYILSVTIPNSEMKKVILLKQKTIIN